MRPIRRAIMVTMTALLAACGASKPAATRPLDTLDAELTGTTVASPTADADPPIAVPLPDDAARSRSAEHDVARPAPATHGGCHECTAARQALTLGALAGRRKRQSGTCSNAISYTTTWSTRLPTSVPLHPGARVTEAAGADGRSCALRIVSFTSAASPQRMLDGYQTRTSAAGFSAGRGADTDGEMLAGSRPGRGAYLVSVRSHVGGGSEVDLIADAR